MGSILTVIERLGDGTPSILAPPNLICVAAWRLCSEDGTLKERIEEEPARSSDGCCRGVLFGWVLIENRLGPGLEGGLCLIYQGNPSIFPKGYLCSVGRPQMPAVQVFGLSLLEKPGVLFIPSSCQSKPPSEGTPETIWVCFVEGTLFAVLNREI